MTLPGNSADRQRPFDIHPTVLRLREEVVGYVRRHKVAPTIEVLGEALKDLSTLPSWDRAEPGHIGQDFLDTLERLDRQTRETVRLTLGLDHPEESLTTRRERRRPGEAGGSAHIQDENYALAKTLSALLAWKGGLSPQSEKTLSGFVIREATIAIAFSRDYEHHAVTLDAECKEDGARIALVPAVQGFYGRARYTVQHWHNGSKEVESGEPIGKLSAGPSSSSEFVDTPGSLYWYYVVPLEPCDVGDRIQIEVASPPPKWFRGDSIETRSIWWRSLGTETRVELQMTARESAIVAVSAVQDDDSSKITPVLAVGRAAELVKGWEPASTWSLMIDKPGANLMLALQWGFKGHDLPK